MLRKLVLPLAIFLLPGASRLLAADTAAKTTETVVVDPAVAADYTKNVVPILTKYCYDCHGNGAHKGDLALDSFKSAEDALKMREKWELVLSNVHKEIMPPEDAAAKPSQAERDAITGWIESALYHFDPKNPDPGRVTLRRLNRAEYDNTIRDLIGVDFHPSEDFPSDDSGYGFDNIGDVLSLSPVLMEKYLAAATKVLDDAIATEPAQSKTKHINANIMEMGFNADGDRGDGWMPLGTLEEDGVSTALPVAEGDYIVRVQAFIRPRGAGGARGGRRGAPPVAADDIIVDDVVPTSATQAAATPRNRNAAARTAGTSVTAATQAAGTSATQAGRGGRGGRRGGARGARGGQRAGQAGGQAGALAGAGAGGQRGGPAAALTGAFAGGLFDVKTLTASGPTSPGLKIALMLDGAVVNDWQVTAVEAKPGVYEYRVGVPAGKHRFAIVNRRLRGGDNELQMKNGRIGVEQGGTVWVKWVEIEGPLKGATRTYKAAALDATGDSLVTANGGRKFEHNGEVAVKFNAPAESEYILRAQASADQAGPDPARMEFHVNDETIKAFDVFAPNKLVPLEDQRVFSMELLNPMPYVYEARVKLKAGENKFSAAFVNDFEDPKSDNPNLRDRNLYIDSLQVVDLSQTQPLPPMPAQVSKLFPAADPTPETKLAAAREILDRFASLAWRRPAQPEELDGLMGLFKEADGDGATFKAAMKLPMKAVLVSPFFLFHGELKGEAGGGQKIDAVRVMHPVGDYALASRLSYFIWSSMPDDELLDLAKRGQLHQNLEAQVKRMLASPKSHALVENFAGQWLQIRNLKFIAPDKDTYPDFDESLRSAMQQETELFFESIMREDRNILDFLTADYTFINERLARHYGIADFQGETFRKVAFPYDNVRAGILTQASVLTITSNPTRTSPVKRGKWVLENLLNSPVPPPPPNVPELKDDGQPTTGTLRQQMEQHRLNPTCASCHQRMDPLGFGLENFDGIGGYRVKDGKFPIDPSGQLVSGEEFKGPAELAHILATKKKGEFVRAFAEKMLTYALGRGVEYYDRPAIDKIVQSMDADQDKFSEAILGVAESIPFQMLRGEADPVVASAPQEAQTMKQANAEGASEHVQ